MNHPLSGASGSPPPPQKVVGGGGGQWCIPVALWGTVVEYSYPLLLKKNSLQIYTDLKNGPGSWKTGSRENGSTI